MARHALDLNKTIFALASGSLPSAVAVVKLAGPRAFEIGQKVIEGDFEKRRDMQLKTIVDREGKKIDEALVLSFVAPFSHTGEDIIEFHCHGSFAIIRRLERTLLDLGAVPAEKGEFSYRALSNDRLSAAELDLLADVFVARESADLDRLYGQRETSFAEEVEKLRGHVIQLQAILDTAVDFSEEYSHVVEKAGSVIQLAIHDSSVISQRYASFRSGSAKPRLVLAGKPNAGKSSLFNALLCNYRAIVHGEPGTTRDVIEEDIEIGGRGWKLVDTAGFREATNTAEREGISLGANYLENATYWILVVDGTEGLGPEETALLERFSTRPHLIVWNKSDLTEWKEPPPTLGAKPLSAKFGIGVGELSGLLADASNSVAHTSGSVPSAVYVARLHQIDELLKSLSMDLANNVPPEYGAEKVREISRAIEGLVGEITPEEVLDRVFKDFCIGK